MEFEWDSEPKKFEWKAGDFVYIPPYCAHQHFANPGNEARFLDGEVYLGMMLDSVKARDLLREDGVIFISIDEKEGDIQ